MASKKFAPKGSKWHFSAGNGGQKYSYLIIIIIITVCNVKGAIRRDEPTENYHPIRHSSFSSMELFSDYQLIVFIFWPKTLLFWFPFTALIVSFRPQLFSAKWSKNPLYTTCSNGRQTKSATKHSVAWSQCSLGSWWRPKNRAKRKVNAGLAFARWPETQFQMNANVAPCLLNV